MDDTETSDSELRILVGVCTLNEADNIKLLIERMRAAIPAADILVVDDDSPDGTAKIVSTIAAADPKVRVIVRNQRGLGGAIREAIRVAVEGHYTFFLNLDGDLSHDPDQLPSLLDRARRMPRVDVVIGSRYVAGGSIMGWPFRRKLMSRLVNRFATTCLRLPVKDCSGSMRCYRVESLERIGTSTLQSEGYSVLEEILIQLHRRNASMAEVPITFHERQNGRSKLTAREAIRSMLQITALVLRK